MTQGDLRDQTLESATVRGAGTGLAQVIIDQQHPARFPAQRHRTVGKGVLQPRGLLVLGDLMRGGLPDINRCKPVAVTIRDLHAGALPRHHRAHRSLPLSPGAGGAASRRRTITASQ
jgi:hypothetical protein